MKYFMKKKGQWAIQKYFFNWKFKTQLFEWRMSQSLISEKLNDTNGAAFFENYFTPKSAAIQQKLQKPWEIPLKRERMKHIAIYSAAI